MASTFDLSRRNPQEDFELITENWERDLRRCIQGNMGF
ncbi:unnamed protein product [Oncorhynchus mykiss]|uniref:Uncharacterized protein n=1 Tax=Oncorhynchus mykiss TaxID=8022 RepID=A0A060YU21_ONCMY|nr:unnamed protein product [Oncorhynchus mykiss]